MSDDTAPASSSNPLLDAAHLARERGWRVLPLYRVAGTEKSCTCSAGMNCKSKGKHPVNTGWREGAPMSYADVQATWDTSHPPNLAVATGADSGFWVFDIDPDKGGFESANALAAQHGPLPATRIVQTGSGGYHYYFALPEGFMPRNKQGGFPDHPGLDVRGEGGLVVVEPSETDKGAYRLYLDAELAQAPDWLLEMVRPTEPTGVVVTAADLPKMTDLEPAEASRLAMYGSTIIKRETERLRAMAMAATPDPSAYRGDPWDGTTFAVACTLLQLANSPWTPLQPSDAYRIVFDNAPRDRDFDDAAVNAKWASAVAKIGNKARPMPPKQDVGPVYPGDPLSDPRSGSAAAAPAATSTTSSSAAPATAPAKVNGNDIPLPAGMRSWDDIGLAQRLIDRYGTTVRRIEQADSWAIYDGGRWTMDDRRFVRYLAQQMILQLPESEGPLYTDPDQREAFTKWAKGCRASARISACLVEAGAHPSLAATMSDFDRDPLLLNALNGYVDLRTGELKAHTPSVDGCRDADGVPVTDMLMQQAPVVYDPAAVAPLWEAFLGRVMPDPSMREYLQAVVGYSITGMITERALFLHHGTGANGKSVFLEIMSAILGDYGQVMPRQTLLVSGQADEHPTAIARQRGKRFMQASETAAGRRLDEEMVKGLTGGEMQTARFMNKDFFDFKPTGKIHLVTNHLPRLTDAASIWSRMHLVGWRETIPLEEQDKLLASKIISQEAAGVLAWAVAGTMMWARKGLPKPHASEMELAAYRADQDEFGLFITERLIVSTDDPASTARVSNNMLYDTYRSWTIQSGISKPMNKPTFLRTMRERGWPTYHSGDERGFRGLSVRVISDPLMSR